MKKKLDPISQAMLNYIIAVEQTFGPLHRNVAPLSDPHDKVNP